MTRVLVDRGRGVLPRNELSYMLRKEGFEVVGGRRREPAGLAEFDRLGADIVLLDLMMPGLPGTEVCKPAPRQVAAFR